MPTAMREQEVMTNRAIAKQVDTSDSRNPDDEGDYICAILYQLPDGRHSRFVDS